MTALAVPLTAIAAPRPVPDVQMLLDRAADGYVADPCHVGVSIAARVDGRTYFANRGSVRRDRVEQPTPDTVYEIASVTKSFVGALAAGALVAGRMTLDGDFRAYLPKRYPNLSVNGQPITLRSLATHTSGLPRDLPDSDALLAKPDFERIGDQLNTLNRGFGQAQSLAALHDIRLRSAPGAAFAYSNIGIRVIGYGLERAYRRPLDALLGARILTPLGMTDTRFAPTPAMRARLATPYSRGGNPQPFHDISAGAAYGLYSTPRDMARYVAWQLDETDPVVARAHGLIRGNQEDGERLIWNIGRDGMAPYLWHGGGSFGETSQMVLYPQDRTGFVLLTNDACEGSESALKAIAIALHRATR